MALYVSGFICEQIIRDENGILTAVKIGDSVTLELPAPVSGKTLIVPQFPCAALIMFRASEDPESFEAEVDLFDPFGKIRGRSTHTVNIAPGTAGNNLRLNLTSLSAAEPGLWHLDVIVRGALALWLPFQVKHKIAEDPTGEPPPTGHSSAASE